MKQAKFTAEQIADYFISKANEQLVDEKTSEGISNLKLQKIMYFAQAAFIVLNDSLLFKEDIEAWKYGPVVPVIYKKYKKQGNKPIQSKTQSEINDEEVLLFLENTWRIFGKYSAGQLVDITHQHKPWVEAYANKNDHKISPNALKSYYKDIFVKS